MPSYRFCRPDDIPYLVRAVNECFDVHFPTQEPMTLERFRWEMKAFDLWPSNSMVASSGQGPIAVMIGTKRAEEVSILRLGVHPDHQRQEHGLHLLTSLSQKLAVLGPERLIMEVPRSIPGLRAFARAASYREEGALTTFVRPAGGVEPVPEDWMIPVTVDELLEQDLLAEEPGSCWQCSWRTLKNRADELQGLAWVSPERLEAFVLFSPPEEAPEIEILAMGGSAGERQEFFLGLLLRSLVNRFPLPSRVSRLPVGDPSEGLLRSLGFEAISIYDRFAARATPA